MMSVVLLAHAWPTVTADGETEELAAVWGTGGRGGDFSCIVDHDGADGVKKREINFGRAGLVKM